MDSHALFVLALFGSLLAVGVPLATRWLLAPSSNAISSSGASSPSSPSSEERLAALEAKVADLCRLRLEWNAVLEEVEDQLETVERKRRRTAASAARASQLAETPQTPEPVAPPEDLTDRAAIRRRALAAGRL